jgi:hypothetical protein
MLNIISRHSLDLHKIYRWIYEWKIKYEIRLHAEPHTKHHIFDYQNFHHILYQDFWSKINETDLQFLVYVLMP